MRQSRVIQIMIIAANLVLAAVCLVAYAKEDKVKPEFMFETGDFIYYLESEETDALLQGIMAHDDRDGDITDRIVIEKITCPRALMRSSLRWCSSFDTVSSPLPVSPLPWKSSACTDVFSSPRSSQVRPCGAV